MIAKKSKGVIDTLSGKGLRFGIVCGRFNSEITKRLLKAAERTFYKKGVLSKSLTMVWVPGAFEIPILLQKLARTGRFHGLVALGAIIRGGTPHFEYVAQGVTIGIVKVSLEEHVPVAFGILTTDNVKQAMERAGGRYGNKGEEAALVAIEMARLIKKRK